MNLKKIWHFLWQSDSALSWIIDLILALAIIKFIFFPLIGLILSSSLPLVAVESTSMIHEGNFDYFWDTHGDFYKQMNITKETFSEWKFKNGFNKGDVMAIQGSDDYNVGDVIVFRVINQATPIIHRIIKKENEVYSTKGDHNQYQLSYETSILKEQIVGKAIGRFPAIGWLKLVFTDAFKSIIK